MLKFLDWRLNSANDSRVRGQPTFPSESDGCGLLSKSVTVRCTVHFYSDLKSAHDCECIGSSLHSHISISPGVNQSSCVGNSNESWVIVGSVAEPTITNFHFNGEIITPRETKFPTKPALPPHATKSSRPKLICHPKRHKASDLG